MEIVYCSQCKGTNIHDRAWVNANTKKFLDFIELDGAVWCDDCKDHVNPKYKDK